MEAAATTPATRSAALHREGLAWAFAGVVMFSFSVPLTKVAVGGFSPFFTATGRAVIAGLLAAIVLWVRRAPLPRDHLRPLLYDVRGGVRMADPAGARASADDQRPRRRDRGIHAADDRTDCGASHP
jgi:hypothetical protein